MMKISREALHAASHAATRRILNTYRTVLAYMCGVGQALVGKNYLAGWLDAEDDMELEDSPAEDGWTEYTADDIAPVLESGDTHIADDDGNLMCSVTADEYEDDDGSFYRSVTYTTYNVRGDICCERVMPGTTAYRFAYASMQAADAVEGHTPYQIVPREVIVQDIGTYVAQMMGEGHGTD